MATRFLRCWPPHRGGGRNPEKRLPTFPLARDSLTTDGKLGWTPLGGYPHLGYLVRFGGITIYHAGDCVPYDDIVDRLRPYSVTVALLPIRGRQNSFDMPEGAQLAQGLAARWLVPMGYGSSPSSSERFIEHMLGHRPAQRFK